jgi:hypothetical protein
MFSLKQAIDHIESQYGKEVNAIQYEDGSRRKFIVEFSDSIGEKVFVKL